MKVNLSQLTRAKIFAGRLAATVLVFASLNSVAWIANLTFWKKQNIVTVNSAVASGPDDGEFIDLSTGSGSDYYGASYMWNNYSTVSSGEWSDASRLINYYRFQLPAGIRPGASISSATISLKGAGEGGWSTTLDALRVWLEDAPSTEQMIIMLQKFPGKGDKLFIDTSVRWPATGGLTWNTGSINKSPSFHTQLQALVNKYGGLAPGAYITVYVGKDITRGGQHYVDSNAFESGDTIPSLSIVYSYPDAGNASRLALVTANTVIDNMECVFVNVVSRDSSDRTSSVAVDKTVTLSSSGGGDFYTDSTCVTSAGGSVILSNTTNQKGFYYKNTTPEPVTLTASTAGFTNGTLGLTIHRAIPVITSRDDGFFQTNGGGANFNPIGDTYRANAVVPIGEWENGIYRTYFRFQIPNDIPFGTTIDTAYLKIVGIDKTNTWDDSVDSVTLYLEDSPNSPQVNNANQIINIDNSDARAKYGGQVPIGDIRWPAAGGLAWPKAVMQKSTDLKTLLQNLVNKYGGLKAGHSVQIWALKTNWTGVSQREIIFQGFDDNPLPPKFVYSLTTPAPGAASNWAVRGPTTIYGTRCSGPFKVISTDGAGVQSNVGANTTANLSGSGTMTFYTDANCASGTASVVVNSGTAVAEFYMKNTALETANVTASGTLTSGDLAVTSAYRGCTWIGNTSNNWNTGSNWSCGSVPGGGVLPYEVAYFDNSCSGSTFGCNVSVNANITPWGVDMDQSYTGTITQNAGQTMDYRTYSVGWNQRGGTFVGGDSTIKLRDFGPFNLSAGIFTSTSGTLAVAYHINITGGTLNTNGGTVQIRNTGDSYPYANSYVYAPGVTFNNFNLGGGYACNEIIVLGTISVAGNLRYMPTDTSCGGYGGFAEGTILLQGDLTATSSDYSHWRDYPINAAETSWIKLVGNNNDQTISATTPLPSVEIAKTGTGSAIISTDTTFSYNFKYTSGNVVTTGVTVTFRPVTEGSIDPGVIEFNNVKIANISNENYQSSTLASPLNVKGTLTVDPVSPTPNITRSCVFNAGTINAYGDVNILTNMGCYWQATDNFLLKLVGTLNQSFTSASTNNEIQSIEIAKTGGTVSFAGSLRFGRNFTHTSGATNDTSTVFQIGGLDAHGSIINAPTMNFPKLTLGKNYAGSFNYANILTTIVGDVYVDNLTMATNALGGPNGGALKVSGNYSCLDANTGAGTTTQLHFIGGVDQTFSSTGCARHYLSHLTVNKTPGTKLTLNNTFWPYVGATHISIQSGIVDQNGSDLRTFSNGTLSVAAGAELRAQGGERTSATGYNFDPASTVRFYGTGDYSANTLNLFNRVATLGNLVLDGVGGIWRSNVALDVAGSFTIANGTYQSNNMMVSVAGDWDKQAGGSYTPGTSLVTLDGGNQAVKGSTTFYQLNKSVGSANSYFLTFDAGATTTITNTMTLQGNSALNRLSLRSSNPGSVFNIDPQGTRTIDYLDVQDSNNTNATAINAPTPNNANSGNNTNWTFP